jgi:hypothetical protein
MPAVTRNLGPRLRDVFVAAISERLTVFIGLSLMKTAASHEYKNWTDVRHFSFVAVLSYLALCAGFGFCRRKYQGGNREN